MKKNREIENKVRKDFKKEKRNTNKYKTHEDALRTVLEQYNINTPEQIKQLIELYDNDYRGSNDHFSMTVLDKLISVFAVLGTWMALANLNDESESIAQMSERLTASVMGVTIAVGVAAVVIAIVVTVVNAWVKVQTGVDVSLVRNLKRIIISGIDKRADNDEQSGESSIGGDEAEEIDEENDQSED